MVIRTPTRTNSPGSPLGLSIPPLRILLFFTQSFSSYPHTYRWYRVMSLFSLNRIIDLIKLRVTITLMELLISLWERQWYTSSKNCSFFLVTPFSLSCMTPSPSPSLSILVQWRPGSTGTLAVEISHLELVVRPPFTTW